MSHNLLSVKAIENIILLLVDASAEIKSARPYGEFKLNTKRTDQYPVLFYDFQQSDLNINNKKYTRDIVMAIGVAEQVWEGRVNEIDMKSRCEGMLQTFLIKLMESSEFSDIGVRFVDKTISMQNLDVTGDDRTVGVFAHVKFSMNLPICEADLPFLPLGTETNTYEPSDPQSLFCSYISSCPVIAEMQDDIALLFALTGGTGGGGSTFVQNGVNTYTGGTAALPTVNVVASPSFTSVSAVTFYSGSTDLSQLLGQGGQSTFLQNGTNITTGGTVFAPTVNLVATPSVAGLIASGTITGSTLQGNTLNHYGETVSGGVYFQTSNALDLAANFTYNNASSILSVRNGFVAPTGGYTGNTFFSGTTDFNHILTSSVSNYFTQSSVTINGNVTITSGLTVSGATIFLGGIEVAEPDGKNPVLWLTFPDQQLTGETAFAYNSLNQQINVPRIRLQEVIVPEMPFRAVIYEDEDTGVLTGQTNFNYVAGASTLTVPVISAVTAHVTNIYSAGTNLNHFLGRTYVQAGTNITTGGTADLPTISVVASPQFTNVTASTFVVSNRIQADMQSVMLTGTAATSSTSLSNVTGLSFPVDANSKYSFMFTIAFQSSSTSGGLGLAVNGPSSPLLVSGMWSGHIAAGTGTRHLTAYDDLGAGALANVASAATNFTAIMNGTLVTGANSGTLQLRFARGGSTGTITLMSGSTGFLTKSS